jgi:hypothetical protein
VFLGVLVHISHQFIQENLTLNTVALIILGNY